MSVDTRSPPERQMLWDGEVDTTVAISAIEHYSYCPRQCALIHVEQIFHENEYTTRGRLVHERVDSGLPSVEAQVRVLRGLPLWSDTLGILGRADLVEMRPEGPYPVEFKSGRPRDPTHAELQLCAQALSLEEMLDRPVLDGAIYYHGTRSRCPVRFDQALRERTIEIISKVRDMVVAQRVPPPTFDRRCRKCSLRKSCLPELIAQPARLRGFQSMLFRVDDP